MARGYLPLLLFLASLWGASYMFIKVAVAEIEPTTMTALRLLLAASILLAVLAARSGVRRAAEDVRRTGAGGVLLGLVNGAIPFTLIAWGEKHIDSGIAAIANSTVPIFVALLAIRFVPSERVRGARLLGVLLGLVGVGVLVGVRPEGGWWAAAGTLAVVVASLSYACANLFSQHRFSHESPLVVATAATLYGGLALLPLGLLQLPVDLPSFKALGSVAALGILGTAVAALVLYHMLATFG
ncbi:MAG: DMT family transporter, partial [Actinomycetota bacterium]|nr:DMT family transporter [Actinomycetota bacterium]